MIPSLQLRRAIDETYREGRNPCKILVSDDFLTELKEEYKSFTIKEGHLIEFDRIPLEIKDNVNSFLIEVAE